tara:strand:- start:265 stop:480 length:216 start_codon:yes stop_codon:yes gene_type:complete
MQNNLLERLKPEYREILEASTYLTLKENVKDSMSNNKTWTSLTISEAMDLHLLLLQKPLNIDDLSNFFYND